jgi:hypothetical protein
LGPTREGDLPGAIGNPNQGSQAPKGLQEINKSPTVRGDLTALNPEQEDLGDWMRRDLQLQRSVDLLKSFDIFRVRP